MDKTTLLKRLYDGEIYPGEAITVSETDQEYINLRNNISSETEYFQALLSPADWKRFEQLDDMKDESTLAYAFENFSYGFRLGVNLMMELSRNNVPQNKPDNIVGFTSIIKYIIIMQIIYIRRERI